jgi:hypothetical protein
MVAVPAFVYSLKEVLAMRNVSREKEDYVSNV